jgi:hypothetical protein
MSWLRLALLLAVMLFGSAAFAGKTSSGSGGVRSSGGGKSYSSGSSSSRPSSSSSSAPKPSSSSSPKPSSGSSTPKPSGASSTPKPSGGSSKPSSSSFDSAAANAAKTAESRSAYNKSTAPNLPPGGANSSQPRNVPAGRSTTNESPTPRGRTYSSGSTNKPVDSTPTYNVGPSPRPNYNDAKGQSRPLDPADARVDNLRNNTNWSTRSTRSGNVFVNVGPPLGYPNVYYRDPYSNIFWWWLLSQSLDTRAYWGYHHYGQMDSLRYRDLLEHDKALEDRIRKLEAEKVKRDPNFTPAGMDNDLMFNDGYVEAAVNPTVNVPEHAPSPTHHSGISCLHFVLVAGIVVFLIWFIFFKRWTGA